jgi:hypothetical protein
VYNSNKPITELTDIRRVEKLDSKSPDCFVKLTPKAARKIEYNPLFCGLLSEPVMRLVTRKHGQNGVNLDPQMAYGDTPLHAKIKHDCNDRIISTEAIEIVQANGAKAILYILLLRMKIN